MTRKEDSLRVAIVGADRVGLEALALLARRKEVHVIGLVDPNDKALGFRLKDHGYRFVDTLRIRQGRRLHDLAALQELDWVIDASEGQKLRKDLMDMDLSPSEILSADSAQFVFGLIQEPDMERRRGLASDAIRKAMESMDASLAGDEPYRLLLRVFKLTTYARSVHGLLLEGARVIGHLRTSGRDGLHISKLNLLEDDGSEAGPADAWMNRVLRGTMNLDAAGDILREDLSGVIPWRAGSSHDIIGLSRFVYAQGEVPHIDGDLRFAASLIRQCQDVLKRIREHENNHFKTLQTALYEEITGVLSSPEPLSATLETVVRRMSALLMTRGCHLYIQDPQTDDLTLIGTTYTFPEMMGQVHIKKNQGIFGEVLARKRPVFLKETDPTFDGRSEVASPSSDVCGMLYLPLNIADPVVRNQEKAVGQERIVGLMLLEFTTLRWMNTPIFQSLIKISHVIAGAISNDSERHRMSQKVNRLSVVNEEGVGLLSSLDRQKIHTLAASSAAMIVDAEVAIFRHFSEDNTLSLGATYGLREEAVDQGLLNIDQKLSARAIEIGEALFINDVREEGLESLPAKFSYRAGLVIPIYHEELFLGTLSVYNKLLFSSFSSTVFTEDDREVLGRFILYIARAIVSLRQHSEQQTFVTIDGDTGLRNDRYLQLRFPEEVRRAKRYHRQVSLIFFEILEEEGQVKKGITGEALYPIAKAIQETFRYIDVLVRLKDSKFAALLPDTGEGVLRAVSRIRERLEEESRVLNKSLKLLAGFSTYPADGEDMAQLVKKASKLFPVS